jgi:hypothetical protein
LFVPIFFVLQAIYLVIFIFFSTVILLGSVVFELPMAFIVNYRIPAEKRPQSKTEKVLANKVHELEKTVEIEIGKRRKAEEVLKTGQVNIAGNSSLAFGSVANEKQTNSSHIDFNTDKIAIGRMENEIHNKKPLNIVKRPTKEQKVGYRD